MEAISANELIAAHRAAGRRFTADGIESYAWEEGSGPPVVLVHGIPSSAFVYRKMLAPLAEGGLRAVTFDFPGSGLAARPRDYDYSATGLVRFLDRALAALGIERCHLVLHDIGGPIGCEWAARHPDRVLSLTLSNTVLNMADHRDPLLVRLARPPFLGALYVAATPTRVYSLLFRRNAVLDQSAISDAEIEAHAKLLTWGDRGRAFRKVNRGWQVPAKEAWLREELPRRPYPAQLVWGRNDPILTERYWKAAQEILGAGEPLLLPARHFLQEDRAPAFADAVVSLAADAA